jgi:hypothetical protein
MLASKAGPVFLADYEAAPRGHKTRVADRLRHALAYATTKGEVVSFNDLTPDQMAQVWRRLDDIEHGRLGYMVQDPYGEAGGVTWISGSGKRTTVMWAELEHTDDEAAA